MKSSFTEVQRFRQWWLLLPMLAFTGWLAYGLLRQLAGGEPFGNNPMSDTGAVIFLLGWGGFLYFFFIYLELRTEVDERGIRTRLRGISTERFGWDQIESTELITYRFVGYGMRLLTRYGTVYNISGNRGLAIRLKDGGRFLIGTRQPDALMACLASLGKVSPTAPSYPPKPDRP
jgi:hypothetical protein